MALLFESLLLDIVAVIIALFSYLYIYTTRNFNYWKKKGVPYIKPVPLFGNLKDQLFARLSPGLQFKTFYDEYPSEKYVGIFQFHKPSIVLRDPDIIKDALVKNFQSFHDRGLETDEERNPLGANLLGLSGARWRALRAKLTPIFTSGKMRMMYHLMEECNKELRFHLQGPAERGDELEMRETMAQLTTDIIGSCAFGLQINSIKNPNSEFRIMGRKIFRSSLAAHFMRTLFLYHPTVAKYFNVKLVDSQVEKFFLGAVKETVEYREKNNIARNDFMQLLIKLKNEEKLDDDEEMANGTSGLHEKDEINMTDALVAAQAFIFFIAGFETSSTLMSFALYELAVNPDVQERLRKEVDDILEEHNGKLSYEALMTMSYLDKVISESLRKYPPGANLLRICTKPYNIPGTSIEIDKGTRMVVPVHALHHDPKYYPKPEKFDPERFSVEEKAKRHHFAYLPFGEGPRNCIGMRFGLLQSKLGLATLMRHYQVSPSEHTQIPLQLDTSSSITAAKGGIHLKISPRP